MMQAGLSTYVRFGKYSVDADAGEGVLVVVGDPLAGTPLRFTGRHAVMLRESIRRGPKDAEAYIRCAVAGIPEILTGRRMIG